MIFPSLFDVTEAVRAAGEVVLRGASSKQVRQKGDSDYVTDSDVAVQEFLRRRLAEDHPHIGFFSEEETEHTLGGELCWVLDPIDGTMNFIRDLSLSAISLALVRGGETLLAAVYNPFLGEMFSAEKGKGAFLNGERIHVGDKSELEGALAAFGTSPYYKPRTAECFDFYRELFLACADVRRLGSAALDICYVAAGRFDCYYEYVLSLWDFAAARLILSEAGGVITDPYGEPTGERKKCGVLAANAFLHPVLKDMIKKYRLEN